MISYSQFLKSNKKFFSTLISLNSIIGNCSSLSELKIKLEIMRMRTDVNTIKALFDITFGIEEQCALADFQNLMNGFRCDTNLAQFLNLTSSKPICNKVNQNALKILLKMLDDKTYDCLFMSGDFLAFVRSDRKILVHDDIDTKFKWKQGIHFADVMRTVVEGQMKMARSYHISKKKAEIAYAASRFFSRLDAKIASYSTRGV